ncbi:MAG: hypothetical protein EXQ56_08015 [Acidobacteria bacterium]|nr:hypothetical protein [Acidobacteriota bacterium]
MRLATTWLTRLAAIFVVGLTCAQAQTADTIFFNGKIVTVDNSFSIAQGVAVAGNKITAVGTNEQVLALAGPNTQKIDLKGRTMIPGLVDTHRHMYSYAEGSYGGLATAEERRRYPIDWRGVSSKEDVLNQIRNSMARYKPAKGQWMYFTHIFSGDMTTEQAKILYDELNQWELEKVAPDNPIALSMGIPDFNGLLANKMAMDILMAKHGDQIRKYGRFWVDQAGRPDGHLEPPASRLILPYTYDRKPEVLARMYKADADEIASMGITTLATRLPKDAENAYRYLRDRNQLTLRIGQGVIESFGELDPAKGQLASLKGKVGSGDDWLWITGIGPTAIDGSTTRACTDQKRTGGAFGALDGWFPVGQCHNDIEYRGSPKRSGPIQGNYYRDWTMESGKNGIRFANVHVAGDRGVGGLLNIMEQIQQQYGPDATKDWAMDHCDMVNPKDFARLGKMKVFMSCYIRLNRLPAMAKSYGEQMANTFHAPVKSMLDAGARVVFETDSGVYIWEHMEDFVVRKDSKGKVWGPQERVDHATILKMTTSWASAYVLKADKVGTIEKGKLADLLVLDRDFLTIPDEQISEVTPLVTMVDGKIAFVHSTFSNEYNLKPANATVSSYPELVKKRPERVLGVNTGG